MRTAAEVGQPAIALLVASLGSLRLIAVEHREHVQQQQQHSSSRASLGSSYVGTCNFWFVFFNRGFLSMFFPSISRLSTTPHFSLLYTTSFLAFRFVFSIPLCSAPTPSFTYACARIHSRQNPQIFNGIYFKYM